MSKSSKFRIYEKAIFDFKNAAKIQECLHPDKSTCGNIIIKAHSIQKNKTLSLIECDIRNDGNKILYSTHSLRYSEDMMKVIGFKEIGKKNASTFTGFCNYHDSTTFSAIENNELDINSDQHCFLLCYRAFSREYHVKREVNQGYKSDEVYKGAIQEWKTQSLINGSQMAIDDHAKLKTKLDEALLSNNYQRLEYITFQLPYTIPLTCSSTITPSFSYSGKLLNKSDDPNDPYEHIFFSVIPTPKETNIVLGYLPEDERSKLYIHELYKLRNKKLEVALSSIIIEQIENNFFSPLIWQKMSANEKKTLLGEIITTSSFEYHLHQNSFFKSKLNLFLPKFKLP